MQEIAFVAPKAAPKSGPGVREAARGTAPDGRGSPDPEPGGDFGSVVDSGKPAAAKKPSAEPGQAEGREAAEPADVVVPSVRKAEPAGESALGSETVPDVPPGVPVPAAVDPEAQPATMEARTAWAPVTDAVATEADVPDGAEAVESVAAPVTNGARAKADAAAPDGAEAVQSVAALVTTGARAAAAAAAPADAAAPAAGAAPAGAFATAAPAPPAAGAAAGAVPPVAMEVDDKASPEPDVVSAGRAGPEAPAGAAQPVDPRAAAPAQPQAIPQPALAGGLALGPAVAVDVDWRLTPHDHPQTLFRMAERVQPQAVTGQIAVAIAQSAGGRVEVRLDPPELGRVQIQLKPTESGVQVVVMAERPETGDLLRRHGETLARDLAESGFGDVTMEFSAGGSGTPGDGHGTEASAPRVLARAEAPSRTAEAAADPPRAVAAGTLDIRL